MGEYKFNATNIITEHFKDEDITFSVVDKGGSEVVQIIFSVKFGPAVILNFVSSDDDNDVNIRCFGLFNDIPREKYIKANRICNDLSKKYTHYKFTFTDNGNINMEYDFPVGISSDCLGRSSWEMIQRAKEILDVEYVDMAKELYGDHLKEPFSEPAPEISFQMDRARREALIRARTERIFRADIEQEDENPAENLDFVEGMLTEKEIQDNISFMKMMAHANDDNEEHADDEGGEDDE